MNITVNDENLRGALKSLQKRHKDGLSILSATSGIPTEKIKTFIAGENNLDLTEISVLNMLK